MTGLVELGSLPESKDKSRAFSLSDFRENRSLGHDPARLWLEQGWQSSIEQTASQLAILKVNHCYSNSKSKQRFLKKTLNTHK